MNYHIIQIPIFFLCHECVFASHFFADVILMIFPSLHSAFFNIFSVFINFKAMPFPETLKNKNNFMTLHKN